MNRIIDLLFPGHCIFCDRLLPWGQRSQICEDCHVEEWLWNGFRCKICSRPVKMQGSVCRSCLVHQIRIPGFSLFPYRGEVKSSIYRFKYEGQRIYGIEYANLLYRYAGKQLEGAAALIPIPVHRKRLRKRGYNQAKVMAEALSRLSEIPCIELLQRIRSTNVQNALSAVGRRKNLEGAFAVVKKKIPEGDLILIDDIYTSGSTVEVAASALSAVFPGRSIRFLTLAMAVSDL